MALLILPVAFVLLWFQVRSHRELLRWPTLTRRGAFLLAFLLFQTVLLAITEVSSVGHLFTADVVLGSWLVFTGALLALSWRGLAGHLRSLGATHPVRRASELGKSDVAAWLLIPSFYFGVFVYLALAYLPSNGDSLDYHLARVEHWIQDQSIGPFAANFTAQVDYSPLAEYNLAHFHLLVGSDRLDGFVQLFAAVVCVVAVTEITRALGGTSLVQVGAAVVATTIPSLVLSATSTENNLFAAAVGACLLFVLLAHDPLRSWWSFALFSGLAASLAVTTKGTLILLLGPAALALFIWRFATATNFGGWIRLWRAVQVVGGIAAIALLVAGPFIYQDEALFGSPAGPDAQAVTTSNLTWRLAGANIVRGTAAEFRFGNGQNGPATATSTFILGKLHRVYDLFGVAQDNPNSFVGPEDSFFFDAFSVRDFGIWDRAEDEGADPLVVVLTLFSGATFVLFLLRGDRRMRVLLLMAVTLTLGYLTFTGVARFQIFAVRFYIPLFVAWSPLIALALHRWSPWLLRAGMVVLAVASLPQLLDNSERPLLKDSYGNNPLAPYFLDSPNPERVLSEATATQNVTAVLAQSTCRELGIGDFVVDEYPVWVGLHRLGWDGRIQDVNVTNATKRYEDPAFHPCAVLTQPNPPYMGTDPDRVQIGFGQFGLSVDPDAMRHVRLPIDGFASDLPAVRVYPGTGWAFTPDPVLSGAGSVFVSSPRAEAVDLRLQGTGGRAVAGVTATTPINGSTPSVSGTNGVVQVDVGPGMTQIKLTPAPTGLGTPLPITSVRAVIAEPR